MDQQYRLDIASALADSLKQPNWNFWTQTFLHLVYLEASHCNGTRFTIACLTSTKFLLGHAFKELNYADPDLFLKVEQHVRKVCK